MKFERAQARGSIALPPWRAALASLLVLISVLAQLGEARAVELGLVLAIDASPSVDAGEYQLQMAGYAAAFRHREMMRAVDSIGDAGMAVTVVLWGGPRDHVTVVDWTIIRDRASARAFADILERVPRTLSTSSTAIGDAITYAIGRFAGNNIKARRWVIDVSGDGRSNTGHQPAVGRDRAVAAGITVNGLTILNDEGGLDLYYLWNVVGGPQSFVEIANDYHDFEEAILRKLIREIRGVPSVHPEPAEHHIDLAMD